MSDTQRYMAPKRDPLDEARRMLDAKAQRIRDAREKLDGQWRSCCLDTQDNLVAVECPLCGALVGSHDEHRHRLYHRANGHVGGEQA